MDYSNLINFLYYIQDKVQDCYKFETSKAIDTFIKSLKQNE